MESDWRNRLPIILSEREISYREFSRRIGKSETYTKKLLSTDHDPSISVMIKMADTLGVSLGFLLFGTDDSPELEMFAREFVKLTRAQKRAVKAVMDTMLETSGDNE